MAPAFSPWFDYGYSPDPVAEFLASLDWIEAEGPFTLALPGHGRAIDDLPAAVRLHRDAVRERLAATLRAVQGGPAGAHRLTARVFGELPPEEGFWRMTEVLSYLRHLRLTGAVTRREANGRFVHEPS